MAVLAIAFTWGFAEATLFFIVPDVWLSYLALSSLKRALRASVLVLAGALLGGALMYQWARADQAHALLAVGSVPAIGVTTMRASAALLRDYGVWALFPGVLEGIPYKTFAVQAPATGVGLLPFLAVAIPARLARLMLVSVATHWIARRWLARFSERARQVTLAVFWLLFYLAYFALHYQK